MMAWLGTALKSSQPSRSARCRSDRPMVRTVGAAAVSCVASGVALPEALPGYGVAMMVVSLCDGRMSRLCGRQQAIGENDHDQGQTRRQETEAGHVAN